MTRITLTLALALALVAGCSDDDKAATPDISVSDFTTSAGGDSGASCGTGIYPCGPYGTSVGNVVENLEFQGFSDPKDLCTKHKDKVMDTTALRKISFKDFHLGGAGCAATKPKVLWVMVSAGWCGPCKYEVATVQGWLKNGQVDERIALFNILFETEKGTVPATEAFIKTWINTYKLSLPVVMDPSFKMGAFFDRKAVPFNMLIDLKTMKVLHRKTGADLQGIGKKAVGYANSL